MVRLATQWDINQILERLDRIEKGGLMANWDVIETELTELRASRDAILKMVEDLKAVIQDGSKEDNAKIAAVAASLDEVGKSLDNALAPKDGGGSTGEVND